MKHFFPNFFVPGAAKSGTSTLHSLLDLHPDICMSKIKEPVYWDSQNLNDFSSKKKRWYSNLFYDKSALIFGESTTSYMFYPNFTTNIIKHYKTAPKFIFILRNPIDRCYSHYSWLIGLDIEKRGFKQAIEQDIKRKFKPYNYFPDYYYHFGLYAKWLTQFYKNFGFRNIKIITLEDLKSNRLNTLNECFSFLGLKPLDDIPEIILNKTGKLKYPRIYHFNLKYLGGKFKISRFIKSFLTDKSYIRLKNKLKKYDFLSNKRTFEYPKISKEQRRFLQKLYHDDVKKLKKLTGQYFDEWTDFNVEK